MIIYPIIELQAGRCVSLSRGRLAEPMIWHADPVEKACEFAAAGAEWMQVTDFDAITGEGDNRAVIGRIIREAGLPVQVAGGIRTEARLREWLDLGAGRVVVGTAAVTNPDFLGAAARYHPDAVVLAVDVSAGRVMCQGWRETTAFAPEDFIAHFEDCPLAALLVTDIDADIGDRDATLGLITGVAEQTRTPVIASGLVREIDDVARIKYLGTIAGVVIGRALFNRSVDLAAALELARGTAEPNPDFI